jgi:hypothetical protein
MQYEQIWCAFDFDAAALEIYDHLTKRYGDKLRFLSPPDLQPWYSKFQATVKSTEQLNKAMALAQQHELHGLAEAFRQTRHFLEQEVLLELP